MLRYITLLHLYNNRTSYYNDVTLLLTGSREFDSNTINRQLPTAYSEYLRDPEGGRDT